MKVKPNFKNSKRILSLLKYFRFLGNRKFGDSDFQFTFASLEIATCSEIVEVNGRTRWLSQHQVEDFQRKSDSTVASRRPRLRSSTLLKHSPVIQSRTSPPILCYKPLTEGILLCKHSGVHIDPDHAETVVPTFSDPFKKIYQKADE